MHTFVIEASARCYGRRLSYRCYWVVFVLAWGGSRIEVGVKKDVVGSLCYWIGFVFRLEDFDDFLALHFSGI